MHVHVCGKSSRGQVSARVRILTNSLASHDVPAVNSHYRDWRDDLINAGAELYELRPDPAIRSLVEVPPVEAEFVGLHTKSVVVDREYVFIGSMNFDPRSFNINTEAGAFVRSPELAANLAEVMNRDMQPARNTSQRIMDKIFKVVPKEQY